jgi:flavin-dependent dehydrogenase
MQTMAVKPRDFVLNTVRGARIFSPGGVKIEVDAKVKKAYAVDRLSFDRHLQDMAIAAGARYADDWALSVIPSVTLKKTGIVKADRVVIASGTDYTLPIKSGFDRPREFLMGGQYEMDIECDSDFVELHFTVPDFFAWVIPLGDRARIGLCVKGNPRPYLDAFVKRLAKEGRLKSDRILSETFGIIPIHNPQTRTQFGNVVTVGDAAGQVKATTGGGIVFGAIAAEYALMPDYDRLWRQRLGTDLRLHLFIHRMINRLSDSGKDRLFRIFRDTHQSLERVGDMDMAAKTAFGLMRDPQFMFKTALNIPWLLADLL